MSERDVLQFPVRRAMRELLISLLPDTSIEAASRLFRERHIHGAPVVGDDGKPRGFVAMSDLVVRTGTTRKGHSRHRLYKGARELFESNFPDLDTRELLGVVEEIMTPSIRTIHAESSLRDAVSLMVAEELHRLLVVEDGVLVGILTTMDVLRMLVPQVGPRKTDGY